MSIVTTKSLDGLHEAVFEEDAEKKIHRYWLDREPTPGVTTFNKDAYPESFFLVGWKIGQGAKFVMDSLLEKARLNEAIDEKWIEQTIKSSKVAFKKAAKEAADIGTLLHDYAYCHETEKPFDDYELIKHPDAQKVLACVAKFKEWKQQNVDEIILSETVVASVRYQFAGKFDRLVRRNGLVILSDFKTSRGIYTDQFIQLASYKIAIEEWLGMQVHGLEVLRFGKDDAEFETKLVTDKDEINAYESQAKRNRETYGFRQRFDKSPF